MFFDVKRVLIIVAAIVGILAVVIFGFLYAGGLIFLDEGKTLYMGTLNEKRVSTAYGEPLDEDTLEALRDSERIDSAPRSSGRRRVLLFLSSGDIIASGFVTSGSGEFSLIKSVNIENVKLPSDLPHMNRDRDMLSNEEVDSILEAGGYFRVESDGRYLTAPIRPELSVLIN